MPVSVVSLGYTVKDDAVTLLVVRMSNMNSAEVAKMTIYTYKSPKWRHT